MGIMLIVVALLIGNYQYVDSTKFVTLMDNLKSRMPQKVKCIRDGTWQRIDAVELVPGDIVRVSADEKIPADLILFDCQDMRVNNSAVTGE